MDAKHGIFKRNQTVIDLGYAPGSWSQVATERTKPHGKVIGIDLIPAEAPRGVITFQGDFLSPMVQKLVKDLIVEAHATKPPPEPEDGESSDGDAAVDVERPSYFDMERQASQEQEPSQARSARRLVDVGHPIRDSARPKSNCANFRPAGCSERHVSTLGANFWL
jgi:21S rRNA (uridine2791-2'-O)-methyltransferase